MRKHAKVRGVQRQAARRRQGERGRGGDFSRELPGDESEGGTGPADPGPLRPMKKDSEDRRKNLV